MDVVVQHAARAHLLHGNEGEFRRYRYYTCYSRVRYGRAGCSAARIDVDHLDGANRHGAAEHAAVAAEIRHTQAAIDRYLTAFENRTLTEAASVTATPRPDRDPRPTPGPPRPAPRPATTRRSSRPPPRRPSSSSPPRRRRRHRHPWPTQSPHETHVAEITIDGDQLIPIFRIPAEDGNGPTGNPVDPTTNISRTGAGCGPPGTRTPNPKIKSLLLYPLS